MPQIVMFPRKSNREKFTDALFQVLPCKSHREIASKLTKEMGRKVAETDVGPLLLWLRQHCHERGYTVPHARRGLYGADEEGNRFFAVLVNAKGEPEIDPLHRIQLNAGLVSTISHAATSAENESEAIKLAAATYKNSTTKRWANSIARRLKQIGEDTRELVEVVQEENGNAA